MVTSMVSVCLLGTLIPLHPRSCDTIKGISRTHARTHTRTHTHTHTNTLVLCIVSLSPLFFTHTHTNTHTHRHTPTHTNAFEILLIFTNINIPDSYNLLFGTFDSIQRGKKVNIYLSIRPSLYMII